MADALSGLNSFLGGLQLSFGNPIGLAMNLILSTIVGGVVILVIVEVFAKKFKEQVKPLNAFLLALVSSLINIFGIVPMLGQYLAMLPMVGFLVIVLPIIVWIVLTKLFFKGLKLTHAVMMGVVCYFVSLYVLPMLIGMVAGYVPGL